MLGPLRKHTRRQNQSPIPPFSQFHFFYISLSSSDLDRRINLRESQLRQTQTARWQRVKATNRSGGRRSPRPDGDSKKKEKRS
jgi:hypothetical protein